MSENQNTTYFVRHHLVITHGMNEKKARGIVRKNRAAILRRLGRYEHPSQIAQGFAGAVAFSAMVRTALVSA